MIFQFQTTYDQKTLTAMAKALRKTVRRKRSRRTHIFGWLLVILALFVFFTTFFLDSTAVDSHTVLTLLVGFAVLIAMIKEDALNGWIAGKRVLADSHEAVTTFTEDAYTTVTNAATSEWRYDHIQVICDTGEYVIFVLDKLHG